MHRQTTLRELLLYAWWRQKTVHYAVRLCSYYGYSACVVEPLAESNFKYWDAQYLKFYDEAESIWESN